MGKWLWGVDIIKSMARLWSAECQNIRTIVSGYLTCICIGQLLVCQLGQVCQLELESPHISISLIIMGIIGTSENPRWVTSGGISACDGPAQGRGAGPITGGGAGAIMSPPPHSRVTCGARHSGHSAEVIHSVQCGRGLPQRGQSASQVMMGLSCEIPESVAHRGMHDRASRERHCAGSPGVVVRASPESNRGR